MWTRRRGLAHLGHGVAAYVGDQANRAVALPEHVQPATLGVRPKPLRNVLHIRNGGAYRNETGAGDGQLHARMR